MTARARVPGSSTSIRAWPAGTGTRSIEPKNSSTATGMPMSASRFSPRREVSRASVRTCARVARGQLAAALMPGVGGAAPTRAR